MNLKIINNKDKGKDWTGVRTSRNIRDQRPKLVSRSLSQQMPTVIINGFVNV